MPNPQINKFTISRQKKSFNKVFKDLIVPFLLILGCIMAYGQTSSGKTFTMKGTESNPGIIPLCLRDIFHKIND